MDAVEVYKNYFIKKEKEINEILNFYKKQNFCIALWGAGKKGSGFLKAFDYSNKRIDYVYDKDVNRTGQKLDSGHVIDDYHNKKADIVLVANSVFELEVIHLLKEAGGSAKVINLDNIILGDLKAEEVIMPKSPDLTKVRECKICAVVVLYKPDISVVENIETYVTDIDKVFLYDNTETSNINEETTQALSKMPNVEYIRKGKNLGLPVAFNEVAELARMQGFQWMITFDQDSLADMGMIAAMREYAESDACDEKTAIIAPVVNEIDTKKETQEIYSTYCDKVIQSGAMHKLSVMDKVGNYDEKMFIDEVDNEYCARCIVNGYKIIKLNNALLMHNQQDGDVEKKFVEGTTVFINKFSPDRYYYRYRNALYCYDLYKETYPLYALDCLNTIRKVELQLKYDGNYEENKKAVQQAKKDFDNGMMGNINNKTIENI